VAKLVPHDIFTLACFYAWHPSTALIGYRSASDCRKCGVVLESSFPIYRPRDQNRDIVILRLHCGTTIPVQIIVKAGVS